MPQQLKPIKPKSKPLTIGPDEQTLRDLLNSPNRSPYETPKSVLSDEYPPIDHAPPFRQEPLVIGQPHTAQTVDDILRIAPELRGRSKRILIGPDEGAVKVLGAAKFKGNEYGKTNLMGTTNPKNYDISMNPRLQGDKNDDNSQMVKYLIHELSHTRRYDDLGEEDENSAYRVDNTVPKSLVHGETMEDIIKEIQSKLLKAGIKSTLGYEGIGPSLKGK